MVHAAILFAPDRSVRRCPAPASRAPSSAPAAGQFADHGIDVDRRYPLLGLMLASTVSAVCWAGLAALVF